MESQDVQSFSPRPIDTPVHALSGAFANRTIRAVLDEVQKADLGRKWVLTCDLANSIESH